MGRTGRNQAVLRGSVDRSQKSTAMVGASPDIACTTLCTACATPRKHRDVTYGDCPSLGLSDPKSWVANAIGRTPKTGGPGPSNQPMCASRVRGTCNAAPPKWFPRWNAGAQGIHLTTRPAPSAGPPTQPHSAAHSRSFANTAVRISGGI